MLDDFKDNQFYQYAINLKKYYHAYIFEVDDVDKCFPLILAFCKMIICKNHYTEDSKCHDCNICHLIDNNTYVDLQIIEPIGASIKKEQVVELQKNMSLKSSNDTNQVYIIKEAEKMNLSAANSLLKFIEEPSPNIYGILVTTNRKAILPTILSRCILIPLILKGKNTYDVQEYTNLVYFLKRLLIEKEKSLAYLKQDFLSFYDNRDALINAFNNMELILDYLIQKKYHQKCYIDSSISDIIDKYLDEFLLCDIINMLEKTVIYKNKLINVLNLNINLFMDRYVIDISEVLM